MNKDFSREVLLEMEPSKQIKVLYTLASFIEQGHFDTASNHFKKLQKYHNFLNDSPNEFIQKLNKEFHKIKAIDYQYEIYMMNLERLLGQSSKEYEFLVKKKDKPTAQKQNQVDIICLLDSIRSAHNVGAMLRNAECFNLKKVVLCGLTASGDHPQVIKTAMGVEKIVAWEYHQDAHEYVQKLKNVGYEIWSIETAHNSTNLNELTERPPKLLIIFGHEHYGISHELIQLSDKIISIPLTGHKNSLNVSVAQGIVLNQLCWLKTSSF